MRTALLRKCGLLVIGGSALASCAAAAPAVYPPRSTFRILPPPSVATDAVAAILLDSHNRERAAVGVPPLVWDPMLASSATSYAGTLAVTGTFQHSPRNIRPGQGENLWMGTRGGFSPRTMVFAWSSEKRMFAPGIFPNVSRTGNWADVAHYTQMIWRTTERLGCGIQSWARSDYLVCRYGPPGNRDGTPVP
jgi:hypothetical protein